MMIYGVYFSPTDNSKKYVDYISQSIEKNATMIDLTFKEESIILNSDDLMIVVAPVYAGRIPNVARGRFKNIKGNNTPCILIATYGNRHYDDALVEMDDLFSSQGFMTIGACAVIGRHTYGDIQVDRPNAEDLEMTCNYVKERISLNIPTRNIPGNHHEDEIVNKGRFHPQTLEGCIKCMKCVHECPVGAILDDCSTISDACISCFRCIRHCPVSQKTMTDEAYINFATMFTEKLKERRENEYFE